MTSPHFWLDPRTIKPLKRYRKSSPKDQGESLDYFINRGCFLMNKSSMECMERLLAIAESEGISVRSEWLGGIRGGLVRIGKEAILFVDESLAVAEQLEHARDSLSRLDWSETPWSDEMRELLGSSGR